MKISELILQLSYERDAYGDLEVRFPNHSAVRGAMRAIDADDPERPAVVFLLEDADLA